MALNTRTKQLGFELHYYFTNSSHTMNAVVRNECESELLVIFSEIINEFGFDIQMETGPYEQGGLREIWSFMGSSAAQLAVIVSLGAAVLTRVPQKPPMTDDGKKIERLTVEKLEKENAIDQITLENLRRKQATDNARQIFSEVKRHGGNPLRHHSKINKHRSAFYKQVQAYDKITKVAITIVDDRGRPLEKPAIVDRKDFNKFIQGEGPQHN